MKFESTPFGESNEHPRSEPHTQDNTELRAVSDGPQITPDAADGGSDRFPAESDATPEPHALEAVMQYVREQSKSGLGAMFEAVQAHEALAEPDVEHPGLLSSYDVPKTVVGERRMGHGLAGQQHFPELDAAGLRVDADAFSPKLVVTNGKAFVNTLGDIRSASPVLRQGLQDIADGFLDTITEVYVPDVFDHSYNRDGHLHSRVVSADDPDPTTTPRYRQATTHMMEQADKVADYLNRLGVDSRTVEGLRSARVAAQEGMLPEWAIIRDRDLDVLPLSHTHESGIRDLAPADWAQVQDFMERAAAKAPPGSRFMHQTATKLLEGIDQVRALYQTADQPLPPARAPFDPIDDIYDADDYIHTEPTPDPALAAQLSEYDRKYFAALDRAERLLRQYIIA